MQRIYPLFPRQGAGVALLALRTCVAGMLFAPVASAAASLEGALAGAVAALLALGALTPGAALAALVLQVAWAAQQDLTWTLVAATQAGCVILLGPGAYSLDALRFGRRMIEWPDPDSDASDEDL